jgi:antitoxin component YwqK of YwqJK toxin-antitoxin module
MKTLLALVASAALLAPLSGCYKSDFETEQKKSAQLESDLKAAKESLSKATVELQKRDQMINQMTTGTTLKVMVDGKPAGQDGIVLGSDGYFYKNGPRVRGVNSLNYSMGKLADGPIALKRESAPEKPYITGFVKNNRADGEWMWYDTAGKLTHKQVFADGKQISVEAASTDKNGKTTFKKLDKAAADKFFDARKNVFSNIPEFMPWTK